MQLNRLKMAIQYRQKKVSRKVVIFHYLYSLSSAASLFTIVTSKYLELSMKILCGHRDEIILVFGFVR